MGTVVLFSSATRATILRENTFASLPGSKLDLKMACRQSAAWLFDDSCLWAALVWEGQCVLTSSGNVQERPSHAETTFHS